MRIGAPRCQANPNHILHAHLNLYSRYTRSMRLCHGVNIPCGDKGGPEHFLGYTLIIFDLSLPIFASEQGAQCGIGSVIHNLLINKRPASTADFSTPDSS